MNNIQSRLLTWIRTTGRYCYDNWAEVVLNDRTSKFLKDLEIDYVEADGLAKFDFSNNGERFLLQDIDIQSMAEEFFIIKFLSGYTRKFDLDQQEFLELYVKGIQEGYNINIRNNRIESIYMRG